MDFLQPSPHQDHSPIFGDAHYFSVNVGDRTVKNAAWTYPSPVSDSFNLSGYIAFECDKMDDWFEEAEQVYIHPRDPHKRIDTLQSTRHVAWYYTYPIMEVSKIAGLICFYNERVDVLSVDSVEQPKPKTPWS